MKPLIIAHRGYSALCKDNTTAAIEKALEVGAEGVELDLQLTSDGEIVAHHDYAPEGRPIATMTLKEFKAAFPHNPTLKEVLEFDALFLLEVKDRRIVEVLSAALPKNTDRIIVSSFDAVFLREFSFLRPDLPTCFILGSVVSAKEALSLLELSRSQFILPAWENRDPFPHTLLKGWLEEVVGKGKKVISWHEEREKELKELFSMSLWGVCTDDPLIARRVRDEGTDRST